MQRRYFPSILLYGFGLALALSLAFNGFLLHEQSRRRNLSADDLGYSVQPVEAGWQQQLSDCKRVNQQKDSLIRRLEQVPNAPPDPGGFVQRTTSK